VVAILTILRLVRAERAAVRTGSQRADGLPTGEGDWLAFHRIALVWLFHAPPWVQEDPEARRLLWRLRICAAVWNAAVLAAVAVQMAMTSMRP